MILFLLSETAYLVGMGGAITTIPNRPENLFLNPASIPQKALYITFYRPFNVEDFYKAEIYTNFHLGNISIGIGSKGTRVNRGYTRLITCEGIKASIFGISLSQRYIKTGSYSTFEPFYNYHAGLNVSIQSLSISFSKERLGIGFISGKGTVTIESTRDFRHLYAGSQFIVNRVISGSVGWMDGHPTVGLYLKNPRFEIEFGFLTNSELGETTIASVRWRL